MTVNQEHCIMLRDYGLPAMNRRGYTTILVLLTMIVDHGKDKC